SSVVPSFVDGSWFLVDESGTALRAEGDSDLLWKLLGISGGYPVTVCGTWNALALAPISVFTGGQVIVL
ncbi:SWIM zinc finger family protein, partial [Rhodococcus erythropolis]|nr:SWIM zinc finger family protein [Rhodococcus erythropolis]